MSKKFQKGLALEYPVIKIKSNSKQPREYFDDAAMEELKLSIKTVGIINPIKVKWLNRDEGTVIIVDGERRWRAAKDLRMETMPVLFGNIDPKDVFKISFVSNYCKEDMTELECAKALAKLIKEGMTRKEAGALIGKSEPWVGSKLTLLNLTPEIQNSLAKGKISAPAAIVVSRFSPAHQKELLSRLNKDAKEKGKPLGLIDAQLQVRKHAEEIGIEQSGGQGNRPMSYGCKVAARVGNSMDRLIESLDLFFKLRADQMHDIGGSAFDQLTRGTNELNKKFKRLEEKADKYSDD